jgi:PAS domain S-box-containing protein
MKLNLLLEQQMKEHLPSGLATGGQLDAFIEAINSSFNSFEREIDLFERSFKQREEEYQNVTAQLKQEVNIKGALISKLIEAVHEIDEAPPAANSEEMEVVNIAAYLKKQIILQRESEKKLLEQKQFYEQILNMIPTDIVVFDNKHRYLFVNPIGIKDPQLRRWIIGKTDEEYCVYRNRDIKIAETRRAVFNDAVDNRRQVEWEDKIKTPTGETEYHLRKMFPVFGTEGELDFVIGYGLNITDRKNIEEKVRLSEKRYKNIFDSSQALICTHDLNGDILEVNNMAISVFGYELGDLVGKPLQSLLPPDKQGAFEKEYLSQIREKGKASGIMVALNRRGEQIYLLYQNFLLEDDVEKPYVIGFSQDITARIIAERALKKSEEKYRGIIANMHLGMMEVDLNEKILYVNNSFCEMSGYDIDELKGGCASEIFLQGENTMMGSEVAMRRSSGESDAYELKVKNKNGDTRWWLISGAPIADNNGAYKGSIGIHLDITNQKLMEIDLRAAKLAAENSAKAKEVFLANMSHEIRTPMNAIIGIGNQLAKTTLDVQQRLFVTTIHNAANNLLVIINDLLDFSKIESGNVTLEKVGCNLASIVANVAGIMKHKAEEKGLLLNMHCDKNIAPVHIGDPYRINQVLLNLVSNAIKFTERGAVTIESRLMSVNRVGNSQEVRFKVTDTGIGMAEEFIEHIFDKFSQEDESITRRYGGTGLGMGISKQLIELMGGTMDIESRKGEGTTITFCIPLQIGKSSDLPKEANVRIGADILRGVSILLVEDNAMNRLLANAILTRYGAQVAEAENGAIAISMLEESLYDVILMDVRMPVKDGIETTKYIRRTLGSSVPVIALTANAFKVEEERCIEAGMNSFISKPFDERKLIQQIAHWAGIEMPTAVETVARPTGGGLYDVGKLTEISRGDKGFVRKMLHQFISLTPPLINDLQQAYEESDFKKVGFLAHKLKPSADILSIDSVRHILDALQEIEKGDGKSDQLTADIKVLAEIMEEVEMDILKNQL